MSPRQHKKRPRQGPDKTTNNKKDTQPDEAPEQIRGPNGGIYNDIIMEVRGRTISTEDENVDQIHWSKIILMIIGEPAYKDINKLWEVMYANASAISTKIRGRRNGHIGLLMGVSVYSNVATTAYARPTEKVTYAQHGPG